MESGSSKEPRNLAGDQGRARLELVEGLDQGSVALFSGVKEPVVSCPLLRFLPDTLDGVVLRGVWRQAVEFDPMPVLAQPGFGLGVEVVTGPVVDDEEDLAARAPDDVLEEVEERESVEDWSELVAKARARFERDGAEDVSGLERDAVSTTKPPSRRESRDKHKGAPPHR